MAESDDEDFAALFAASEGKRTRERRVAAGDVVHGRVIAVGATSAFVAVGAKAEATIELGEFRDPARGGVRGAAPTLPDHEARGGGSQRRRLAPAAPRRGGDEAGGGGLGRASRGRGRRRHRHVAPRLRGVRRSRGRRWPDPRERARLRPGVPPVRRTAGGPAGRGAGREARARPEGWAWPRGALPPRARTRSVGDGGGALPGGSERARNGATTRAVRSVRGTRAAHRRARARLAPGARPPRVPSATDR